MKNNTGNVRPNERYGRLLTVQISGYNKDGRPLWECQCNCGNKKIALAKLLRNGMTQSCGCIARENPPRVSHGKTGTAIYRCWHNMHVRCYYKRSKSYRDYGGRGIRVCNRWQTFENFLADMGEPPFKGATIERRNNNGHYEPDNCYWATRLEQGKNRRNNHVLELNGVSHHISEWSRLTGIKVTTIYQRIRREWSTEQALTREVSPRA